MRRTTPFLAVGLVVGVLDLSTKAASVTAGRLSSGYQDLVGGLESLVSPTRFVADVSLLVLVLGLVGGVVLVMLENAEGRVGAVGDKCPVCGRQTERMKEKRFHRMLSMFMGRELTRRRCGECHWTGISVKYWSGFGRREPANEP